MSQTNALPNDLEACHALISQQDEINQSLALELEKAKFELAQLKRYIYGQRSERHVQDDGQLTLFDHEQEPAQQSADEADVIEEEITYRRRRRGKSDRFPENLPREVQTIDVPEEERRCSCCGEEMPIIATDITERVDLITADLFVWEIHRYKTCVGQMQRHHCTDPGG